MSYIYREAENAARKFNTRNPFKLLDAIGAHTRYSYEYEPDGLKGFSAILNRHMFAVINGKLDEYDRRIVAGHEAAHLLLHWREILSSPASALKDFDLFGNTNRLEHQANQFLADFLMSDDDVLAAIADERDYFSTAKELFVPPPLLAFKLYSMMQRGFNIRPPVDLKSDFLVKAEMWV